MTATIIIKNSTGLEPTFSSEILDMEASTSRGTTAFEYVPIGEAPRGAGAWLSLDRSGPVTIAPYTQAELRLRVDVPADAGAGGHFAGIVFSAPDPRPDAEFRFEVNQPIPVFITVRGEFERDLRVTATPLDRWMWRGGVADVDVRIRNEGDVHEPFDGRVRLDGLFASAVSRRLDAGILLPGEERTERLRFDVRSAPDLLRGDARVSLDGDRTVSDDVPRIVVLPIWVLVVLVLAILVVVVRGRMHRHAPTGPEYDADDDWIDPAG